MLYGILKEDPSIANNRELTAIFATPLAILSEPLGVTAESINFKRYTMEQTAQRWVIESDVNPGNELPDFLSDRLTKGDSGIVYVQFPQPYSASNKKINGTPRTLQAHQKRTKTIKVSGTLIPNLFISIGSFPSKVYLITRVDSATQEIDIFPGLVKDMPIDSVIYHSENVIMRANYGGDVVRGIKYEGGILANPGSVKLVEVV
jgi:hypothetical protein